MSLRDIIVDTRVSTLTRRGRHQCGRLVLFIGKKQCYFETQTQTQMHLFGRKYKTYNFLDVHKHKTI